tara:strand:- start:36 stop:785 length:750 start_codon:yes stop_codon:yes gene_type:complete
MSDETIPFGPEHDTLGKRLKHIREFRRFSRKQLAEASGVSEKTIERYEYETTDAKWGQVTQLAGALDVPISVFAGGEAANDDAPFDSVPGPVKSASNVVSERTGLTDQNQRLDALLSEIEDTRLEGFGNYPRYTVALLDDLRDTLRYFEFSEITSLTSEIDIKNPDGKRLFVDESNLNGTLERIVDVAVIGCDLCSLSQQRLEKIAKKAGVSAPFLGWDDPSEIIEHLRPKLRSQCLARKDLGRLPELE